MKITALIPVFIMFLFSCTKPKQENSLKPLDNPYYDKAFEFREQDKPDSAFFYFNKAKDFFIAAQDSFGAGKCLVNMAIISSDKGDYFGGQELSLDALSFFNEADTNQHIYIKSNLNNLGVCNYLLKDYTRAITFYRKASQYTSDRVGIFTIDNNIANAYRRGNKLKDALAIYRNILKRNLNQDEFARTLADFAYTKWLEDKFYDANAELQKALTIHEKMGNKYAQIANLVYFIEVNEKARPHAALAYAQKMYTLATSTGNPNEQLISLQKLVTLSKDNHVKEYFTKYHALSDSIQNARNAAKNQFALIRYDSEKSKADNLRLQKENTEQRYQVVKRDLFIIAGIILFALSLAIVGLWYRKRKEKMEADKRKAISDSQLITSKRVHDVVANGLYRVIKEIEYGEHIDKELILDKLDDMYEKSRDISYDSNPSMEAEEDFHLKINHLLNSFSKPHTQILIQGNTAAYWWGISPKCRNEIEHILQELMVNMDKHSKATMVSTHFQRHADQAQISYSDNGIGIAGELRQQNGLRNTESRIKLINGNITFDNNVDQGLKILISYPLA